MSQLSTYRVYNNSAPPVSLPQTHIVFRSGNMSNSSHTARNPSYRSASASAAPVNKSSDHNDAVTDGLGGEGSMPLLDLHGFTKENAIRQLTTFLERHEMAPWVCVVTGAGSHSPDGPVIRNAVKKLLTKRKMEFRKLTPGSFMVNASTGIVLQAPDPPVDTKLKVIPRPSLSNLISKSAKDESSNAGHGRAATDNDIILRPISRKKKLLIEQQSRHHQPQTENNQDFINPGRVVPYPHHPQARQPYQQATLNPSSTGVTSSGWGDTGGMAQSGGGGGGYSRPSTRGPRPMPSMSELARESDTSDPTKLLMTNDPLLKRRMSAPVPSTGSSDREEKELLKAMEMSKEWEERRRRDSKITSELADREEELLKQALTMSEYETETERRLREEEEKIFQQILEASKAQAEKEERAKSAVISEIDDDDEDAQLRAALAESVANTPAPGHMNDDEDEEQLKAVLELSLKEATASLPPSMLDRDEEECKLELKDSASKQTSSAGECDGDAEFKAALAASMHEMVAIRPVSRIDSDLAFRPTSESRRPSAYQQPNFVAQTRASKRLSRKDMSVGEQKDDEQQQNDHHYHYPPSASNNDDEPLVPLSVARAQIEEEQALERLLREKLALTEAQDVARRSSKVAVDRTTATMAAPGTAIAVPIPVPEMTTTTTTRVSAASAEAAASSPVTRSSTGTVAVVANGETKSSCCIIL